MNAFPLTYLGAGCLEAALPYHASRLAEMYGKGEVVIVEEVNELSQKSHARYLVAVATACALETMWEFLKAAKLAGENGVTVPFQPSRAKVGEVVKALCVVTLLDGRIEAPAWLDHRWRAVDEWLLGRTQNRTPTAAEDTSK